MLFQQREATQKRANELDCSNVFLYRRILLVLYFYTEKMEFLLVKLTIDC